MHGFFYEATQMFSLMIRRENIIKILPKFADKERGVID